MARKTRRRVRVVTSRFIEKKGSKWTNEEVNCIRYLRDEGLSNYSISVIISRTVKGVEAKLSESDKILDRLSSRMTVPKMNMEDVSHEE